jgi:hypothetical protein
MKRNVVYISLVLFLYLFVGIAGDAVEKPTHGRGCRVMTLIKKYLEK